MKTFRLIIVSSKGNLFKGEVYKLSLRGIEGDFAVMAEHIPFITVINPCNYYIEMPNEERKTGYSDIGLLVVSSEEVTLISGKTEIYKK